MNRTILSRALLLVGAIACSSAAHAVSLGGDDESNVASAPTQTWFFPDGSSHAVNVGPEPSTVAGSTDTSVMGAGPAPSFDDASGRESSSQASASPDGSSHAVAGGESLSASMDSGEAW